MTLHLSENINTNSLKIIHINVNSIIKISRRYELQNFLSNNNPDIVLLNETKLNPRYNLCFNGYKMIRKDRFGSKKGGGTAVLIKNCIKYNNYENQITNSLDQLETCIIKIPLNHNKTLFIISAYYPAGSNSSNLKTELYKTFNSMHLQDLNNYYILAGDLNCKHSNWGNQTNNSKGNILKKWLEDYEIEFKCKLYASTYPSYPRCGCFLDICLADSRIKLNAENNTTNCLKCIPYDSDHNALEIHFSQ